MNTGMSTLRWFLLAAWFGSWALFAVGVAPAAFRLLPVDQAGAVASALLRGLHLYGLFAALCLSAIAFAKQQKGPLLWLPLALALLCALTEFGITPAIEGSKPSEIGPETAAGAGERFQRLHLASRVVFSAVLVGSGALIALHARAEAPDARR